MSDPRLVPWVGVRYSGTVVCAHCNCMAGAGEVFVALLYSTMVKSDMTKNTSCTSERCSWIVPSQNPYVSCMSCM